MARNNRLMERPFRIFRCIGIICLLSLATMQQAIAVPMVIEFTASGFRSTGGGLMYVDSGMLTPNTLSDGLPGDFAGFTALDLTLTRISAPNPGTFDFQIADLSRFVLSVDGTGIIDDLNFWGAAGRANVVGLSPTTAFTASFDCGVMCGDENIQFTVDSVSPVDVPEPPPPARVPEPGTVALLGLGLAGMGFSRRKKQV